MLLGTMCFLFRAGHTSFWTRGRVIRSLNSKPKHSNAPIEGQQWFETANKEVCNKVFWKSHSPCEVGDYFSWFPIWSLDLLFCDFFKVFLSTTLERFGLFILIKTKRIWMFAFISVPVLPPARLHCCWFTRWKLHITVISWCIWTNNLKTHGRHDKFEDPDS